MKETAIRPEDLLVLIDRELRRRAPRDCDRCSVSLPFRLPAAMPGGGDWHAMPEGDCPTHCTLLVEEIVEELRRRYRLAGSPG